MSDKDDNDNFDLDDDNSFDEFEGEQNTLGSVIQNNPLAKVGIIFAVAALIFGIIILFGGSGDQTQFSMQTRGSEVSGVPGTEDISPAMRDAITEVNERMVEEAQMTGDSAIPIPIDPPAGFLPQAPAEEDTEDPLQKWRRLQQERLDRELQRREIIQPATVPEDNQQQQAIASLAEVMSAQMQSILERQGQAKWQTMQVTDPDFLDKLAAESDAGLETEIVGEADGGELVDEILLPAGEISYAQLITEANSDIPGPVVAQIVSGPLRGSRVLGTFSADTDDSKLITLNFETIVIDGVSYSISGIALDPNTTLPGMATDVDNRYLRRIALPMAAAFVEGAAEAVAESGRTNVTIAGESVAEETEETTDEQEIASGIEEAGAELREILEEMSDVEPLIVIASGTPISILFLEPVTKPVEETDF